jgi:hypothetical protein
VVCTTDFPFRRERPGEKGTDASDLIKGRSWRDFLLRLCCAAREAGKDLEPVLEEQGGAVSPASRPGFPFLESIVPAGGFVENPRFVRAEFPTALSPEVMAVETSGFLL